MVSSPESGAWPSRSRAGSVETSVPSDQESWPECDKDTEEHVSGADTDMDTSLSSNDSPVPPTSVLITSTPLQPSNKIMPRPPPMSFLFPSPDYASFPASRIPSRPYSSLSGSSASLASKPSSAAPSLPPKPASLTALVTKQQLPRTRSVSKSPASFHDYENYFFIWREQSKKNVWSLGGLMMPASCKMLEKRETER